MARSLLIHNAVMRLWPLGKLINRAANLPLIGPLFEPLASSSKDEALIIPVQQAVVGTESLVLPYQLLAPLIEGTSARILMNHCLCRQGEGCTSYPKDIGCIFLGQGAGGIHTRLGRAVDADEALAHVGNGMSAGLTPLVVHSAFDAWLLGIPYRRTLAVCLCCECCCSVQQGLLLGPSSFWETVVRVPGLSINIAQACTGCGECVPVCPVRAISLDGGHASVSELCKGCGRCVAACPVKAVEIHLDESIDSSRQLLARIAQRTDIGLEATGRTG